MRKTRIAINGLGRVGRPLMKMMIESREFDLVAVNDLADIENIKYLLMYDSAYGRQEIDVKSAGGKIIVNGAEILYISEKDPAKLPWKDNDIDIVVECTGFFASAEKSKVHLAAGAKRVVVSAPFEGHGDNNENGAHDGTVIVGINENELKSCEISSNASCTTNSAAPVMQILHEGVGIEKAFLSTVHAYTSTQRLVDSPDGKDWRRGRAGSANIIPSTTGAAIAVTKAIPDLDGLFDGIAIRVPILTGSLVDLTFLAKRNTSVKEVNEILELAARSPRWEKTFCVTRDPIVSSDIVGDRHASIADLGFTRVVGGNFVKVLAWYDNEIGYVASLLEHVRAVSKFLQQ